MSDTPLFAELVEEHGFDPREREEVPMGDLVERFRLHLLFCTFGEECTDPVHRAALAWERDLQVAWWPAGAELLAGEDATVAGELVEHERPAHRADAPVDGEPEAEPEEEPDAEPAERVER